MNSLKETRLKFATCELKAKSWWVPHYNRNILQKLAGIRAWRFWRCSIFGACVAAHRAS